MQVSSIEGECYDWNYEDGAPICGVRLVRDYGNGCTETIDVSMWCEYPIGFQAHGHVVERRTPNSYVAGIEDLTELDEGEVELCKAAFAAGGGLQ